MVDIISGMIIVIWPVNSNVIIIADTRLCVAPTTKLPPPTIAQALEGWLLPKYQKNGHITLPIRAPK